jgi:hypothetical protein
MPSNETIPWFNLAQDLLKSLQTQIEAFNLMS